MDVISGNFKHWSTNIWSVRLKNSLGLISYLRLKPWSKMFWKTYFLHIGHKIVHPHLPNHCTLYIYCLNHYKLDFTLEHFTVRNHFVREAPEQQLRKQFKGAHLKRKWSKIWTMIRAFVLFVRWFGKTNHITKNVFGT